MYLYESSKIDKLQHKGRKKGKNNLKISKWECIIIIAVKNIISKFILNTYIKWINT